MADSDTDNVPRLRGMKVVAEALRLEDFPMDRMDVNYSVGDIEVVNSEGKFVLVSELMDGISQESFDTVQDVMRALHSQVAPGKKAA